MHDVTTINDRVSVGPQPTEHDFADLERRGFRSVVNLRAAGEDDQPLSPEEEEVQAAKRNMRYLHVPVSGTAPRLDHVDQLSEELDRLPPPVFVHDRTGKTAGTLVLLYLGEEEGWSDDETLERIRRMGFDDGSPEMQDFIRGYLKKRRRAAAPHPHE